MMNTQRKYRCRKCGVEVLAGPYIAPELCGACQLAANAEIARKAKGGEVMGTSRVAIAGGAFRVRTGNLCTMFSSLESAAEQIALLHDEIERLQKDRSRSENELDRLREWVAAVEDGYDKQKAEIERLRGDAASLAVAREQLLVQADEIKRLLRSHYEIERLKALVIRAWHSFRSGGLTQANGMPYCLSDADMAELKRLADAEKLREQAPPT